MSIYRRTLYQPYSVHVGRNSSEVIDGITNKSNNIIHIINMTLNLISSTFILSAILIALFSLHVKIALASFVGFGIIYISINLLTKRRLFKNSKIISEQSILTIKSLQEGLGGIREILINNNQKRYCDIYNKAEVSLRNAQSSNQFISFGPRYGIEAMGIVIISILAY
jgi:ATP-binding cassette subfamily B protein